MAAVGDEPFEMTCESDSESVNEFCNSHSEVKEELLEYSDSENGENDSDYCEAADGGSGIRLKSEPLEAGHGDYMYEQEGSIEDDAIVKAKTRVGDENLEDEVEPIVKLEPLSDEETDIEMEESTSMSTTNEEVSAFISECCSSGSPPQV